MGQNNFAPFQFTPEFPTYHNTRCLNDSSDLDLQSLTYGGRFQVDDVCIYPGPWDATKSEREYQPTRSSPRQSFKVGSPAAHIHECASARHSRVSRVPEVHPSTRGVNHHRMRAEPCRRSVDGGTDSDQVLLVACYSSSDGSETGGSR